jgi:hypothetical protein
MVITIALYKTFTIILYAFSLLLLMLPSSICNNYMFMKGMYKLIYVLITASGIIRIQD